MAYNVLNMWRVKKHIKSHFCECLKFSHDDDRYMIFLKNMYNLELTVISKYLQKVYILISRIQNTVPMKSLNIILRFIFSNMRS